MGIARNYLLCGCLVLLSAPSGAAQDSGAPLTSVDRQVQAAALDRASAMNARQSQEPPLMTEALRRLESGDEVPDIVADVRRHRANVERLCSALPTFAATVGALACLPANAVWPGASITCGGMAALNSISYCGELKELYSIEVAPTRELLDRFSRTENGRELWNDAFAAANGGLRLDDSAADVLARHAELARVFEDQFGEDLLKRLKDGSLDQQQPDSSEILALEERMTEVLEAVHAEIELRGETVETFVKEAWAQERQARDDRRRNIDAANAKATFRVATALIGQADETAGRKLQAVGNAAFGLYDAVEAFNIADGLSANPLLAQVALAGSLVKVGLGFVNGLSDTGPTIEEVILDRIDALDGKIEDLRLEMGARFDLVHMHLDRVITKLDDGFQAVRDHIDDTERELKAALDGIGSDLENLDAEIEGVAHAVHFTYRDDLRRHTAVMEAILGPGTLGCTRAIQGQLTLSDGQCSLHFLNLANLVELDQIEALPDDMFIDAYSTHTDRTTNIGFLEFRRRLADVGTTPLRSDSVVGPEAWFDVMKAKEEFLDFHRGDLSEGRLEVLVIPEFRSIMAGHQSDLASYRQAIVEELKAFGDDENPRQTVFSTMIEEARRQLFDLEDLIQSTVRPWFETGDYDGRTLPSAGGGVRPETMYRHPYDWVGMADFYGAAGSERPAWLNIRSQNECSGRDGRDGTDDLVKWRPDGRFLDAWFGGSGVADFVQEEDLMPARLGMGTIEVCVTAVGEPRTPSYIEAQIWFDWAEGEWGESIPGCPQRVPLLHRVGAGNGQLAGEAGLMAMMTDIARQVRGRDGLLVGVDGRWPSCRELYLARFDDKRRALADHVRAELPDYEQFREIDRALDSLELYVQSWLKLALDGARGRSETVDALISGEIGLPDVSGLLERDAQWYAWELADQGAAALGELEETLRSGRFGDALSFGTEHRLLDRHYRSLGGR